MALQIRTFRDNTVTNFLSSNLLPLRNKTKTMPNVKVSYLCGASQRGEKALVQAFLKEGVDVNCKDENETTPLFYASVKGHVDVVNMLLCYGANLEDRNNEGDTALIRSSYNGKLEVVKELIMWGANVNAKESSDQTSLYWASRNGHLDVVRTLLANGAKINKREREGETPLIASSFRGHSEVVKELIRCGADVKAKRKDGKTSLDVASEKGHVDVANILMENGGKLGTSTKIPIIILQQTNIIKFENSTLNITNSRFILNSDINSSNISNGERSGYQVFINSAGGLPMLMNRAPTDIFHCATSNTTTRDLQQALSWPG